MEEQVSEGSALETCLLNIYKLNDGEDKPVYPEARMRHFLDVISSGLVSFCRSQLPESKELYTQPFSEVKGKLKQVSNLVVSFSRMVSKLTEFDFRDSDHPWGAEAYSNKGSTMFADRVREIEGARKSVEEMKGLINKGQRNVFEKSTVFSPFLNFGDTLLTSTYTSSKWSEAVASFEASLSGIEQGIGGEIKNRVKGMEGKPLAALSKLRRYSNLLKRTSVRKAVSAVLDPMSSSLLDVISDLENEVDKSDDNEEEDKVKAIIKTRQVGNKVKGILEGCKEISLGNDVSSACQDLMDKCGRFEKHLFNTWVEDTQDVMEDGNARVEMTGRLMEIDKKGMLRVNYKER